MVFRKLDSTLYLPVKWKAVGIPADQSVGVAMEIPTITRNDIPLARPASLMSVGIMLTEEVTAGLLRFQLTVDGTPVGPTFDMTSGSGTEAIWEFRPGQLTAIKGKKIGIVVGSSAALLPAGAIEAVCFLEVRWDG